MLNVDTTFNRRVQRPAVNDVGKEAQPGLETSPAIDIMGLFVDTGILLSKQKVHV